jgi:quercetin dioxygenase-like cupin family protein
MFYKNSDDGFSPALPGVSRKTLVYGDNTLLAEFRLEAGHQLPMHAHEQEQSGYLVSGALLLTIGTDTFQVEPGDSWCVPGNVLHGAQVLADAVAIEIFAPLRADYLPNA